MTSIRSSALRSLPALVALAGLALFLGACGKTEKPAAKAADTKLTTEDQKVSYGIGYNMGKSAAEQTQMTVDKDAFRAGLDDGLAKGKMRLSEQELQAAFESFQKRVVAAAQAEGQKQLTEGTAFLEKNKKRIGVKTTASGLQYEVIKSGTGPKPKATSTVVVHYHGTLLDGTVFDSSVERGEPMTMQVGGVIPGWVEVLQLMSVGDKWKVYIPPSLAYGPRTRGKIPANAVLTFEIELKEIK